MSEFEIGDLVVYTAHGDKSYMGAFEGYVNDSNDYARVKILKFYSSKRLSTAIGGDWGIGITRVSVSYWLSPVSPLWQLAECAE